MQKELLIRETLGCSRSNTIQDLIYPVSDTGEEQEDVDRNMSALGKVIHCGTNSAAMFIAEASTILDETPPFRQIQSVKVTLQVKCTSLLFCPRVPRTSPKERRPASIIVKSSNEVTEFHPYSRESSEMFPPGE